MPVSPDLQQLVDQVTASTSVETSAVALINGFAARLQAVIDAGGSPQQFQDLATSLKSSADALAAAITANTPVTPQQAKQKK